MNPETRPGQLPHDLDVTEILPGNTAEEFAHLMSRISGGITLEEARYLHDLAAAVPSGEIIEVGSFRGKSSVALALGARQANQRTGNSVTLHCIEPHRPFTGIYGGNFGPEDRREFYRVMLATGAFENTSLINLSSENLQHNWHGPISLCFIDGDHSYAGVSKDYACWGERIARNGLLVFDDAADPAIGPAKLVAELLKTGEWEKIPAVGKLCTLRKLKPVQPPLTGMAPASQTERKLNILVLIERPMLNGGIIRFHRLMKAMEPWGHRLRFLSLQGFSGEQAAGCDFTRHNITLEEASQQQWDAVMVPGQSFAPETIEKFALFRAPNFGIRVQHILNDTSRIEGFRQTNSVFDPDLVIFNNRAWPDGSYTDFRGKQFHVLEGAVDSAFFAPSCIDIPFARSNRQSADDIIIGGLAFKNPVPLLNALRELPGNIGLALFGTMPPDIAEHYADLIQADRLQFVGPLDQHQLRHFYQQMDMIISTEEFAGWSNLTAEAMACGVPVICTPHGTRAFARHGETALVIEQATPEEIFRAVLHLLNHKAETVLRAKLARETISRFDWHRYASHMATLLSRTPESHYYRAEQLGLYGKWGLEDRFRGLEPVFELAKEQQIIDLGAAEGLVTLQCMQSGAHSAIGFEIDSDRVQTANRMLEQLGHGQQASLHVGNLMHWDKFVADHAERLRDTYDMVLYLGIHHHLGHQDSRLAALAGALGMARQWFVIRTPGRFWQEDRIQEFIISRGWQPVSGEQNLPADMTYLGEVRIYQPGARQ